MVSKEGYHYDRYKLLWITDDLIENLDQIMTTSFNEGCHISVKENVRKRQPAYMFAFGRKVEARLGDIFP
jgi:glutamate dehydrogenase/leucine dehydrogenase